MTMTRSIYADKSRKQLVDIFYPVGSFYANINPTSPEILFGGTWIPIDQGIFPMAAGSDFVAGSTGGYADATLVKHKHQLTSVAPIYGAASGWTYHAPMRGNDDSYGMGHDTSESGDDGTGKNRPPYIAIYMWYRTA